MHKVDPIQIMLSDIFEKVFYNREQEPKTTICLECEGTGAAFIEVPRPQNFDRDIGYLDEEVIEGGCEECSGTGLVEDEDDG
ncbi:MAG: hypothetical protein HKN32_03610 [Flavobacteriales bacterium]|nr:hypothetical protein [Flavobacteriales bacterium]